MIEVKDRIKAHYKNNSVNFIISNDDMHKDCFRRQFFFLYRARLNSLIDRILENGKHLLGNDISLTQLADISVVNENVFVAGIVLKKMSFRRSVLNDFAEEETLDFEYRKKMRGTNLVSDTDVLELEGDQQVVKLVGSIDKDHFVTGNVIGIYGHIMTGDLFKVERVILPTVAPQVIWPIVEADCYVAFLSGISMTGDLRNNIDVAYGLEKLIGWICAESLVSDEEINIVRNIARIVIAGDSVRITKKDEDDQRIEILASDHSVDKDAIEQFDKFLCRLVSTVSVDLMSGPTDPNTVLLPQQSIPRVIFPWARRFGKMFNTVTNPYKFSINGISFLGTSGQNICDLSRLTVGRSAIQLMADCLERSHIFPTVPDSLDGFPFEKRDPFILDEMPHVFFAGNQSELVHGWLDNASRNVSTLLLTVPAFRHKQTLTLLNLRNMRITEYDFSQNENFANILA